MRLAIINLTGGGASGGLKKYLLNILPRLAASKEIQAILCASPDMLEAGSWLPHGPKISYVSCSPFIPFRHSPNPGLAVELDSFKPDLLFIPIERYVNYRGLPAVVMLHNMAPFSGVKTGRGLKERIINLARLHETKVALERSTEFIVPTEFVKDFLVKKTGSPAGKITAVHFGQNPVPGTARPPSSFPAGDKFIFTAGSMEEYRGLEDLISALPLIKGSFPGIKLVVAGGARPATMAYLDGLKALAGKLGVSGEIVWPGNIPEEELSWLYSNSAAFVITSRMESFCFVALEALTHGCNIVSTDSACLPEIFGKAALYYKAGEDKALAAALSAVLSRTPAERRVSSSAAASRAAGFSWDKAAAATIEVLKKAVSGA